jgi:hypothetical protein
MSWPGFEPRPPAWEASTLEKSHPDSLLIVIRNLYLLARDNTISFTHVGKSDFFLLLVTAVPYTVFFLVSVIL